MSETVEHVAWLCFRHRGDNRQPYLTLCDSDTLGAFKVFRESAPPPDREAMCIRYRNHLGPCNGLPRIDCPNTKRENGNS